MNQRFTFCIRRGIIYGIVGKENASDASPGFEYFSGKEQNMKHIAAILKGMLIGIANVIPGFSGGTMAVILDVYDVFVYTLGNILSHPIQAVKKGWGLFLGILLGVIFAVLAVVKLLEAFPVQTMLFFVGLTLGSLPEFFSRVKAEGKPSFGNMTAFVVAAAVIILLQVLNPAAAGNISLSFGTYVALLLFGVVCAAAMVLPGVSGSLLLMLFGFYEFIMGAIKNTLSGLVHFDLSLLGGNILAVLVFGIGAVIGLVGCSKLVSRLLEKYKKGTSYAIFGLLAASPVALVISMIKNYGDAFGGLGVGGIVFAVLSFVLGTFLVLLYAKIGSRRKNDLSEE